MTRLTSKPRTVEVVTHYDTLGVSPGADPRTIRDAYHALAREFAPRVLGDTGEEFKKYALAYGVLKNKEFREAYDIRLRLEKVLNCPTCGGRGLKDGFKGGKYVKGQLCGLCAGRGRQ